MRSSLRHLLLTLVFAPIVACGPAGDSPELDELRAGDEEVLEAGLSTPVPVGSQLRTTARISFRTGPGLEFQRLSVLPRRAIVEAVQGSPTNNYYNVRFNGVVGWASGEYLVLVSSGASAPTSPAPAPAPTPAPTPESPESPTAPSGGTGGTGGALTNSTFLSFSNGQYTSRYHLYAAGLDWTRPVGLLVYCDGSGEFGLKNPGSTYLLAGTNGLINVARRNNMVLLTPFAPNPACSDGDGSCWYLGDPPGYARWSADLIKDVQSRYDIHKNRVALGGYSSGAQWLTEYFAPAGWADDIMTDGVAVAISYGGSPKVAQSFTSSFKANVHFNWNTGDRDEAYTRTDGFGVRAGFSSYTNNGFATSLDLISGLGHSRSDFGLVMDAQIKEHVPTGSAAP